MAPSTADPQQGLRRVATLVACDAADRTLFAAVCEEVARILGAHTSNLYRCEGGGRAVALGAWAASKAQSVEAGSEVPLDGETAIAQVFRTREPAQVDDYAALPGGFAEHLRSLGIRASVAAPVFLQGELWGALTASSVNAEPLPADALERIAEFAELVSQSLANREAQHQLRAERDFARALVEITKSLVCVFDREGRIVEFNRACEEATGFAAPDLIGHDARQSVIPPEEHEGFQALLDRAWIHREPTPMRADWLTATGRRRRLDWTNRPLIGGDGSVQALVCTGLDVTDSERATREIVRLAEEQTALRRVATLVASDASPGDVFEAVAEESGRLVGAASAATVRYVGETAVTIGRWSAGDEVGFPVGTVIPLTDSEGLTAVVARTGAVARVRSYEGLRGEPARTLAELGFRSAAAAPIVVDGATWGALLVASSEPEPLGIDVERRLNGFAELVALAVAGANAREELTASRARLVEAGLAERRRLERNLHDGAQQRLVTLSLQLSLARAPIRDEPAEAETLIETATDELELALEDLRELARGLHPAILADRGLRPALEALASRAPFVVHVTGVPEQRLPANVEAALYYVVSESLANAAKHAEARNVSVELTGSADAVAVAVRDDGRGGARLGGGSGLDGLTDRVAALGGSLSVESEPGRGTTIGARLPLDDDRRG
jgi:PAS domain S-box-containing protein